MTFFNRLLGDCIGAMDDEWISVIDVGRYHGKRKSTVFKILKRLGIKPRKVRSEASKNQLTAQITRAEYRRVRAELQLLSERNGSEETHDEDTDGFVSAEEGVFYLLQLEPKFDPGRFKLGFAASLPERLRHAKCFAPFAVTVRFWPCRRQWEKTAIDCVTVGCERLYTEVFRATSLDEVIERSERFFAMMPPIQANPAN